MVDGAPAYFEMEEGMKAHFCIKVDPESDAKGKVKVRLDKAFGRTMMFFSDVSKKPTPDNAAHTCKVDKTTYIRSVQKSEYN